MNGEKYIDIDELIAQLIDEFAKAAGMCQAGQLSEEEIRELLTTVRDFTFTPERADKGTVVPKRAPSPVPATESKGFHIHVEPTRPVRRTRIDTADPKESGPAATEQKGQEPETPGPDDTQSIDLPAPLGPRPNGSGVQHYHFGKDRSRRSTEPPRK